MGKHSKKSKKKHSKKSKKYNRRSSSSSSEASSDEWVEKETIVNKSSKQILESNSSSASRSDNEEWTEKDITSNKTTSEKTENERDEWMSLPTVFATTSNDERRKEREKNKQKDKEDSTYDPRKSGRELNPYWKDGGDGLPSLNQKAKFMKPTDNEEKSYSSSYNKYRSHTSSWRKSSNDRSDRSSSSNWRKSSKETFEKSSNSNWRTSSKETSDRLSSSNWRKSSPKKEDKSDEPISIKDQYSSVETKSKAESSDQSASSSDILTDKEMNEIASKLVKAEILGNTAKIKELTEKLNRAREARANTPATANKNKAEEDDVLLYRTDSKGYSKPLAAPESSADSYNKRKKRVETHDSGKRQKYYPDDDKYDLKQMFEMEKFNTSDQDAEFVKLTSKVSKMTDLDDIFMDRIREEKSGDKKAQKERDRAIREHKKISSALDNCTHCLQSSTMLKHLMISLGETIYLSLPPHEPLTEGHCLIIPTRHVSCSTQLDENEWAEILDFRKALTNMFSSQDKDVIFYETVLNVNSYSHMVLHCVPLPKEQGNLAPMYFKKAIDECETEWSTNKKLISLAGKGVRRAVPKGLPYFFVSFGMSEGYAHVIEDHRHFSPFFAPEVIGGILDLNHKKWRKQYNEKFEQQKSRVLEFSQGWKTFDCTIKS